VGVLRDANAARRAGGARAGALAGGRRALDIARVQAHALRARLRYLGRRFRVEGASYRYLVHRYNETWTNERAVEVPLALRRLRRARGPVLEVGNVLSHYTRTSHERIDKYETAPGVLNRDVDDLEARRAYALILSISTLEHVGFDEEVQDAAKPARAVERLKACLAPGGELFVTLPLGYNPAADAMVLAGAAFERVALLRRATPTNLWVEATREEAASARYGAPFAAANVLAVCSWKAK
jgi:hypothetical protein